MNSENPAQGEAPLTLGAPTGCGWAGWARGGSAAGSSSWTWGGTGAGAAAGAACLLPGAGTTMGLRLRRMPGGGGVALPGATARPASLLELPTAASLAAAAAPWAGTTCPCWLGWAAGVAERRAAAPAACRPAGGAPASASAPAAVPAGWAGLALRALAPPRPLAAGAAGASGCCCCCWLEAGEAPSVRCDSLRFASCCCFLAAA